jgi:hypothetical protein
VLGLHGPDPAGPVGRGVQKSLIVRAVADAVSTELERFTVHGILMGDVTHPV